MARSPASTMVSDCQSAHRMFIVGAIVVAVFLQICSSNVRPALARAAAGQGGIGFQPGPEAANTDADQGGADGHHGQRWEQNSMLPIRLSFPSGSATWSTEFFSHESGIVSWGGRIGWGGHVLKGIVPSDWARYGLAYSLIGLRMRYLVMAKLKHVQITPYETLWRPGNYIVEGGTGRTYGREITIWDPHVVYDTALLSPALSLYVVTEPWVRRTRPENRDDLAAGETFSEYAVGGECRWSFLPGGTEPPWYPFFLTVAIGYKGHTGSTAAGFNEWPDQGWSIVLEAGIGGFLLKGASVRPSH